MLDFGEPGEEDSAGASYGVTYFDGKSWHMFYLGTPNVTPAPELVPSFPYLTMKAHAKSPDGPWTKQPEVVPFRTQSGTYYSATVSEPCRGRDGFWDNDPRVQAHGATLKYPSGV